MQNLIRRCTAYRRSQGEQLWKKVEAAVDSGAVDTVANPKDFPTCRVKETPESKRAECWIGAGGDDIPKPGNMHINCVTDEGRQMMMSAKAGKVNKTLLSASRLNEAGYDVQLTSRPCIKYVKAGERIAVKKNMVCI